uniref:40-residue YVTN family beta-propeller repeat-containing protein n=1 Tax=Candidatus Kentrum sp. LFY TaxID=2126342 RepID=A0A450UL11_9GAMM|nr:MAG: 40-residue YVTN family beta-propeller repeat-containing protein [Candidatus Kentron sp. LFY]
MKKTNIQAKRISSPAFLMLAMLFLMARPAFAGLERLAFVASEGGNSVTIIDLITEKSLKVLPTGKTPHAMAAAPEGKIFVNNRGSRDLTVIDANRLEVIATIPLPAISFQLAMSPDGKTLAVVYKDGLELSLVDVASNAITETLEVGEADKGFEKPMMKHPLWTPDGRFVYVSDSVHDTLVKIDVSEGVITKKIPLPGINHYLHLSPDGGTIYAVNETTRDGTSVTLIDRATDTVIADLPIPLAPGEKGKGHHGNFSPDHRYFFFSNLGSSGLHVLDVQSRKWIETIQTGKGPGHPAISRDGKYIFVVHHKDGVISIIDLDKQKFIKNIEIGKGKKEAHAFYFTPDGKYFHAISAQDNLMVKIDVERLEVASTMPVAKASMFFAIKEGDTYPPTE